MNVTLNNVKAEDDGTLISGATSTSPTLTLDPIKNVDFGNSAFMVPPVLMKGLQTGQPFTYSSGDNGAIGGLISNTVYYIIVPSDLTDEIQLAATLTDANAGNYITFQQYPTLSGGPAGSQITVPISDVDEATGTITFDSNPGFTDGEPLTYHAVDGEMIGGLTDGATYYAIVGSATSLTLQLAASPPTSTGDRAAIPLNLDPIFLGFQQKLPVTINPSGNQFPANAIEFGFNTGFLSGDSFIYQGSKISGLSDGTRYFVIPDANNPNVIQLSSTFSNDAPGDPVPIGSAAGGSDGTAALVFDPSVRIDSGNNTIDMGFNYALAGTLPSGTELTYRGSLGTSVSGLTDGKAYYLIQDYANPRLMRLTDTSPAAGDRGRGGRAGHLQRPVQCRVPTWLMMRIWRATPGDTSDAMAAGTAAAEAALALTDNGEDWTAAAIDTERSGDAPPSVSFQVVVDPTAQTVNFGSSVGFVPNESLVYEGPTTGNQGINGLTVGDTYLITLPDPEDEPGLVQFVDSNGSLVQVSLGSGTTTTVMFGAPSSDNVSVSGNELTFNNPDDPANPFDPGLVTGNPFVYSGPVSPSVDSGITGLSPGVVYYVITTSTPGVIQLADTLEHALAGVALSPQISLPAGTVSTNIQFALPLAPTDARPAGGYDPARQHRPRRHGLPESIHRLADDADPAVDRRGECHGQRGGLRKPAYATSGIGGTPSFSDKLLRSPRVCRSSLTL